MKRTLGLIVVGAVLIANVVSASPVSAASYKNDVRVCNSADSKNNIYAHNSGRDKYSKIITSGNCHWVPNSNGKLRVQIYGLSYKWKVKGKSISGCKDQADHKLGTKYNGTKVSFRDSNKSC